MDREVNDGGAGGTSDEEPGGDLESDEEDEGNTRGAHLGRRTTEPAGIRGHPPAGGLGRAAARRLARRRRRGS
jgi:hypothetical protein